jgi:hypothetical protein
MSAARYFTAVIIFQAASHSSFYPPTHTRLSTISQIRTAKKTNLSLQLFRLFRGRKCSFRGIPSFAEEPIPKLGTEFELRKTVSLLLYFAIRRGLSACFLPRFVLHGTEFWDVFSSAEWFGTKFREFASADNNGAANDYILSAEGCHTRPDHSAEKFCRGQEHPNGSKGTLRPDFQAITRTRIFFTKPISPQDTGWQL